MLHVLTDEFHAWEEAALRSPQLRNQPAELDLGCGKGGFLLQLAARYPERLILGADIMIGRLRRVERKVERGELRNVELLRIDAWNLIARMIPDESLSRVHILCPDPWPKKRHRAQRLVSSEFLGRLSRKLIPGGILHMATDNVPYFEQMQATIAPLPHFAPAPDGIADIADIQTDFELQWLGQGIPTQHVAHARVMP
ncbi:MAG: tRNA (guanine-N7-)-methyltransferase [Rhodothermales bacterium]|jgi:tRNA (guanine-N7-)-methyltransferase